MAPFGIEFVDRCCLRTDRVLSLRHIVSDLSESIYGRSACAQKSRYNDRVSDFLPGTLSSFVAANRVEYFERN
ncbi:MAG: hypothetical protein KGQ60_17710 [Planctomycetes bacterium]|nr:hypothetical protein [Planctomycetota bacterium]